MRYDWIQLRGAALLLDAPGGMVETRSSGASAEQLQAWRAALGVDRRGNGPMLSEGSEVGCLLLPLTDAGTAVGQLELYVDSG